MSVCLKDACELMMDDGGVEFCVRIDSSAENQKNCQLDYFILGNP